MRIRDVGANSRGVRMGYLTFSPSEYSLTSIYTT